MFLVIQTYSWLFGIGWLVMVGLILYMVMVLKNIWQLRVEKFFRRLQNDEKFLERIVSSAKKMPGNIMFGVAWFFVVLVTVVAFTNIYTIQSTGQLLISFQQMVWLLAGVFQLIAWPFVEGFFIFAKWMGATTPEGPVNPKFLQLFYEISASFVWGIVFWTLVPFDNWIKVADEDAGEEEERVNAQTKNRRIRNAFRLLGILGLFLWINLTGKFDRTMCPIWANQGLERIGAMFDHYGQQALVYEAPKAQTDSTGVMPVPYSTTTTKGGKPSTTGVVAVGPDGKPLVTANESGGGGGWVWILLIVAILVIATFLFLLKKKPELLPKFGKKKEGVEGGQQQPQPQEQYDWDAIYNELAKPEFNTNWRLNCDKVIGAAPETEKQRFINLRNEMVELYDASTDRQAGILDAYLKAGSIPEAEKTRALRLISCLQATVLSSSPEGQIAASAKKTFFS